MLYELKIPCKGVIVAMMKQRWPSLQGGLYMIIEARKTQIRSKKVREALEIQLQNTSSHNENGLNQYDVQYVTTRFWKPMFSYLREKTIH